MKQWLKYGFLFWFGGSFYITLEILYRGYSHWSMGVLAGIVFIAIGLLNKVWGWETDLILQILVGTAIATVGEFITGCIVNLWLGWNVWSYSHKWGNVLGQICPQFVLIWIPIVLLAIVLDDIIRYRFFREERPRYWIGNKCFEIKFKEDV